jgi:spermidine synthase
VASKGSARKRETKTGESAKRESASMGRGPFFALLLSVFSAGAASLLYEVVWVRQLGHSLGSTAVATSVMLSAFLGGLALGSWYAGRIADSLESPLATLAKLEISAAVVGALSVPALSFAGRAYVYIASITSAGPLVSLVLRAAFALVVMMVPATVFGATFPLATAAAGRLTDREDAAGGVSAASCFGSAVGAAVGGLLLEPALGLTGSALVGSGLNVLAAVLAIVAARAAYGAAASRMASAS